MTFVGPVDQAETDMLQEQDLKGKVALVTYVFFSTVDHDANKHSSRLLSS